MRSTNKADSSPRETLTCAAEVRGGLIIRAGRPAAALEAEWAQGQFPPAMIQETLLEIDNRRPFVPYALRLNSGGDVQIDKPEHCFLTEDGETLMFNESGGKLKFIAVANIALVE